MFVNFAWRVTRRLSILFAVVFGLFGCTERGLETIQNTYAAEPYVANFNNLNKMHEELDKLERALQETQVPKAWQPPPYGEKPKTGDKDEGSSGSWLTSWWPFSSHVKQVGNTFEVKCVGFGTNDKDNKGIVWKNEYDANANDCSHVGEIPQKVLVAYIRGRSEEADGYCQAFFTGLDKLSSSTRYARDVVNDSFDLTTVILGLTQTAAHQLAILAGAQTFISGQFDSFERFMLLAPEPFRIHKFVQAKQREFRENGANNIDSITTLDRAQRWVRDYANFCTMKGIKQIVDEAISSQEISIAQGDAQDQVMRSDRIRSQINAALSQAIHRALPNTGSVKIELGHMDVIPVYWFFKLRSEAAPDEKALDKKGEATTAASKLDPKLKVLADYMKNGEVQAADEDPGELKQGEAETKDHARKVKLHEDFNTVRSLATEYGEFLINPHTPAGKTIAADAEDARAAYYSSKPAKTTTADNSNTNGGGGNNDGAGGTGGGTGNNDGSGSGAGGNNGGANNNGGSGSSGGAGGNNNGGGSNSNNGQH